ncbi:MAG: flagellar basal body L-ring protein FlgH [Syntrophobacteraceae bacterium]|jgi:flagellar L-ring protein precursor FlgH
MRRYKRLGAGTNSAAILLISAAMLVLVLPGCAGVKSNKDQAASMSPPKQLSGPKLLPMPEAGPQPATLASSGSLWSSSSGSLYADIRAAKIGDILTITISENSSASKAAATTAERSKNTSGSFTFAGAGLGASANKGAFSFGPYNGAFSNTFKGDGSTTQTDSMTAYMTATVIDVLPNGNLLIRGSRWTKVNDELQQIVLEGVVRPIDISRNNTVLSQNVAEAKIFLLGKGPVAQHQKPGWLNQILDFVTPF